MGRHLNTKNFDFFYRTKEENMAAPVGCGSRQQMRKDIDLYHPVKPITPKEVVNKKLAQIPSAVIESFNELIAAHWDGTESRFDLKDVSNLVLTKMGITNGEVHTWWYEIDDIYEKAGWKVEYIKPDYTENFSPYFIFSKKRGG